MSVNKKIPQLPTGSSLQVADKFPISRGGANYYLTGQMIIDACATDITALSASVLALENTRLKLDGSNGPMTGTLAMGANKVTSSYVPVNAVDLTNKLYVDTKLSKAGGTMTGEIVLAGNPTLNTHAVTKQYVDFAISSLPPGLDDTNGLTEGSDGSATGAGSEVDGNKYFYTQARFDTAFAAKTTDSLDEGLVNLYFTTPRFNTSFATKTTSNLVEGTNLYFTNARARAAISGVSPILYDSVTGVIDFDPTGLAPTFGTTTKIPYMNGTNDDFIYSTGLTFNGTKLTATQISVGGFYTLPLADGASNSILKTDGSGVTSFVTLASLGLPTGTGTANFLTKWSGTTTQTSSLIQDNGTSLGVGVAPNATRFFSLESALSRVLQITQSSTEADTYGAYIDMAGASATSKRGIIATVKSGAVNIGGHFIAGDTNTAFPATTDIGVFGSSQASSRLSLGVYGSAITVNSQPNIGGSFIASNGSANYALQLQDGTEGSGKFLKSVTAAGRANWAQITKADITNGISGAGTTSYLARWSDSSTLTSGTVRDDGTTVGIGIAPNAAVQLYVSTTSLIAIQGTTTMSGSQGVSGSSNGIGAGTNSGVKGSAAFSTALNIGVEGSATGGTTAIGAAFIATTGAANYALRLQDGTEGIGKFLKSITANGEANWASISNTDVSGLGTLSTQNGTFTDKANKSGETLTDPLLTVSSPSANSIGYLGVPQNSKSADYTTVMSDSGKGIFHPGSDANARTFTIASNASVAYPLHTAITFVNMSANNVTIAIASDTLYLAGAGTTGSRTLAQYGIATALKVSNTEWLISGINLT